MTGAACSATAGENAVGGGGGALDGLIAALADTCVATGLSKLACKYFAEGAKPMLGDPPCQALAGTILFVSCAHAFPPSPVWEDGVKGSTCCAFGVGPQGPAVAADVF